MVPDIYLIIILFILLTSLGNYYYMVTSCLSYFTDIMYHDHTVDVVTVIILELSQ